MVLSRLPNDCVVTALANYTGSTYDEVLSVLEKVRGKGEGVHCGVGYYRNTWLFTLACLKKRMPRQAQLVTHGLLRFSHVFDGHPGHLTVIEVDGTVVDGSLAQGRLPLVTYLNTYPYYIVDEVWQ